MTKEAIEYFKENIFLFFDENLPNEVKSMVREWINVIYTENKGYRIVWHDLVDKLHLILEKKNYRISSDIYDLIATFTNRYNQETSSNRLLEEILNCNKIFPTMTNDALTILINKENLAKEGNLGFYLSILKNIMIICYNFNFQDFNEFIEENLENWMKILYNTCNIVLENNISQEAIDLNACTLKIINHWTANYHEDIKSYCSNFQEPLWNMINKIDVSNPKIEKLVFEVIDFYKISFMNKLVSFDLEKVNFIINKLVFPNLMLGENEIDDFNNDKLAFLKSEIEEVEDQSGK
jgi:hypothetical protein